MLLARLFMLVLSVKFMLKGNKRPNSMLFFEMEHLTCTLWGEYGKQVVIEKNNKSIIVCVVRLACVTEYKESASYHIHQTHAKLWSGEDIWDYEIYNQKRKTEPLIKYYKRRMKKNKERSREQATKKKEEEEET
ncbi:unnamed protein product [Eruca vesicaria subsp. sativa]|uniref:Uncharacterized protein n=1 Tax=Eruca vesicaria subsp. sativa TaxID=29727 RepID=A0ABC8KLT7_ERUVS|nr:unnamed protein product [Eruca vesicaria subsp. sativa]